MEIWAIGSLDPEETIIEFAEDFDITIPVLIDADGEAAKLYPYPMAFPTALFPQIWIVGVDGKVAYVSNHYEPDAIALVLQAELTP